MKKLKYLFYIICSVWFLAASNSCTQIILEVGPTGRTTLFLPAGYLTTCSEFFGNSSVTLTVEVEGVVGGNIELLSEEIFIINNDDQDPNNINLEIDIPTEGTFTVSVTAEVTCHECCNIPNECSPEDGLALFFGQSMSINVTSLIEPTVIPIMEGCSNCGC